MKRVRSSTPSKRDGGSCRRLFEHKQTVFSLRLPRSTLASLLNNEQLLKTFAKWDISRLFVRCVGQDVFFREAVHGDANVYVMAPPSGPFGCRPNHAIPADPRCAHPVTVLSSIRRARSASLERVQHRKLSQLVEDASVLNTSTRTKTHVRR